MYIASGWTNIRKLKRIEVGLGFTRPNEGILDDNIDDGQMLVLAVMAAMIYLYILSFKSVLLEIVVMITNILLICILFYYMLNIEYRA